MAKLSYWRYREHTAFNRLMEAAKGLDTLSRDTGLEPWYRYLDAYDRWIEEKIAEEHAA